MSVDLKPVLNYPDTLLGEWIFLNDSLLRGNFPDGASTLTNALNANTSSPRTRAKEIYRIGLLKKELTSRKAKETLKSIHEGCNLQTRLGYLSAIIYKALTDHDSPKIKEAFYALNALYSIFISFELDGEQFSYNTLIRRLLSIFPCPREYNINKWLRYIFSAVVCELTVEQKTNEIKELLLGTRRSIKLRIIDNNTNDVKGQFETVEELKKVIDNRVSLVDIYNQKLGLFFFGDNDELPKGYYGIANKYCSDFLDSCFQIDISNIRNSPFKKLYQKTEDEDTACILEILKEISKDNQEFETKYQKIMKSIEEGAIAALSFMTDKPMSDFEVPKRNFEIEDGNNIINSLRTKPFLLLAGISGTGKSRKVQELAYLTCKRDGEHDKDKTAPGNYMLIPVKPNWHDSTELLGYYSSITGKYVLTDFIRFVWKAWVHRDVPYFLCLDEMNLAPVEQYFAEYLSILETRKLVYNETLKKYEIQSAELLSKKIFENLPTEFRNEPKDKVITYSGLTTDSRPEIVQLYKGEDIQIMNFLKENGLRLPENLFVVGTVNMDDTTHQFSRKVIDRAFTIEMNGGKLEKMFGAKDTLAYQDNPMLFDEIKPLFVKAQEVLDVYTGDAKTIIKIVPGLLDRLNGEGIFKDTPFRVSYRVQNELVLYYAAIRPEGDLTEEQIISYLYEAFMAVLLEKILPRVEGDEKAMKCNEKGDSVILKNIEKYLNELKPANGEPSSTYETLMAKLSEMNERVKNSYFTSFFS